MFCDSLGTRGLTGPAGEWDCYGGGGKGRLGRLRGLYSRFRPIRVEEEGRVFAPVGRSSTGEENPVEENPVEEGGGPLSSEGETGGGVEKTVAAPPRLVDHDIHLDVDEPFSQLCVVTNLVRLGQRRGVFFNFAGVADGVIRVKRDWLARRVAAAQAAAGADGIEGKGEDSILWLNHDQVVGLKVKVEERTCVRRAPVLMLRDEDPAVTYKIQYEGNVLAIPLPQCLKRMGVVNWLIL